MFLNVLFLLDSYDLSNRGYNEEEFSVKKGVFLDMLDLSENSPVLEAHLNNSLKSSCKLTSL